MNYKHLFLASAILLSGNSFAQKKKKDDTKEKKTEWDVANPGMGFNYKTHSFTTDEGTWMNLDVSPDGQTVVFDLLGDIYSIPLSGGKAKITKWDSV